MDKLKLDIVSENFDQYFAKTCTHMGPDEKAQIPSSIISRLFVYKGKINQRSMDRIGFLGKVLVLYKALRKRIFILVEGNESEGAMSVKDFVNYRAAAKEKDFGEANAREILTHAHFVVGGRELMDGMSYLNDLSTGPAYNYLTRLKNGNKDSVSDWKMQRDFLMKFLLNFESNKKRWLKQYDLSMSEYLILMYTYHGREVTGSEIYNTGLIHAHFSGASKIREGLSSLKNRKYITKQGVSKGTLFRITPIGKHIVDEIVNKYALNL